MRQNETQIERVEAMKKRTALIALRMRHGLTQEQAAERLEMTRASYSMIECGVRTGRLDFWQRLQKVFNLSNAEMWDLINETEEKETRKKVCNRN